MNFELSSPFSPTGDQPEAIAALSDGIKSGVPFQTLLGVTGSGKTFTIANVIKEVRKPTLILSHNKTLAAQLYSEFKAFFPNNAVEYFVSYYDYYQPEAYLPTTDTYIEKDLQINDEIDKLRLRATASLLSGRKDVIVVSSVSCLYGMADPTAFAEKVVHLEKGRGASNNWKNCLEDIWFFTKSKDYTFNLEAVKVQRRVIAPYRDKSGLPKDWVQNDDERYRLTAPSNIWTDISIPFWSMPENTPHPTQKPEKLIAKLILASSNPGDLIFDPFVGSGTTAVTAKKLGRHYVGIEREKEYVALALKRLELAEENREIQGYENGIFRARNG